VSEAVRQAGLEALLQHPALWRGRNAAPGATLTTGFAALDAVLPGGGWPGRGLVEILTPGPGHGELRLWAPLVATLSQHESARWCALVSPPFEPYLPAWQSRGVRPERLLVTRGAQGAWAMEHCLRSGACALVFGWLAQATMRELRRFALAAEKGAALGVLIRPLRAAQAHSAAVLRIALTAITGGLRVQLLKGRGVTPLTLEVAA
jgi:protein ImuA